jgi:hypothetical protein
MRTDSSPLLTHGVSLLDRTLWFGQAELHETHIHISGWHWTGRYERRIDLDEVQQAETWSRTREANLVLRLDDGNAALRLDAGVMLWHWKLKELGVDVVGRG